MNLKGTLTTRLGIATPTRLGMATPTDDFESFCKGLQASFGEDISFLLFNGEILTLERFDDESILEEAFLSEQTCK